MYKRQVSRSGVLYTLDLEPAALSADDVWEKLDRIQKSSREVFEQAQESLWDARRLDVYKRQARGRGLRSHRYIRTIFVGRGGRKRTCACGHCARVSIAHFIAVARVVPVSYTHLWEH